MSMNTDQEQQEWGIKVNIGARSYRSNDGPTWANQHLREKWNKPGVVLWSVEQQQITSLGGMVYTAR